MVFQSGLSFFFFSEKLLDIHDWNLNVMTGLKIKGYISAAPTLLSGVGQVLYQATLQINHHVL